MKIRSQNNTRRANRQSSFDFLYQSVQLPEAGSPEDAVWEYIHTHKQHLGLQIVTFLFKIVTK